MKFKKKFGKRFLANVVSAALLTSTVTFSLPTNVTAADGNDYYEALALSLYMYDANACGNDVDDGPLTWRGDCHTYDEFPGGYHDAGDHIKFNLTMGFAGSSLAMADYLNPGVFEKAGCKDHLISILKRNADYLMSTTILNGDSVEKIAHVVADGNVDHSEWSSPEVQTYPRQVYWLTAGSNNSAVCGEMAAALAGTAYVVKDSDPAYAETCIKYAKALVDFGKNHVGNESGGLSGFYDTEAQYQDEIAVAEAWLWICGAGSKPTLVPEGGGKYSGDAGYDGYRYCWNKVFQGYAALMYKATGDSMWATELQTEIDKQGGLRVGTYNGDGWGAARYNCALQMSGYAVANGDASNQYATAGKWQMDYILGENPTGYSFLIGYGNKWPTHYHHRAANPGNGDPSQNPEAKYTLYGALVGGIDASGNYQDMTDKYQYTEPALDYNGCFVLACAGLAGLYGGSDAGAKNIVSNASEIKKGYSFGGGETVIPTQPETETNAEPTENTSNAQDTTEDTQPATGNQTGGLVQADVTKEGDNKYNVDVKDSEKVVVHGLTNTADQNANGRYTIYDESGNQIKEDTWNLTPDNGKFDIEVELSDNASNVVVEFYWPREASVESAEILRSGGTDPTEPETTEPAPTETDPPQPTETPSETNTEGNVVYGDVDEDGKVQMVDMILLNKYLMIGASITDQGKKNADVNRDGEVLSDDGLNILRSVIGLIDLPIQ